MFGCSFVYFHKHGQGAVSAAISHKDDLDIILSNEFNKLTNTDSFCFVVAGDDDFELNFGWIEFFHYFLENRFYTRFTKKEGCTFNLVCFSNLILCVSACLHVAIN